MELGTFGAICKFAIELEKQAGAYYLAAQTGAPAEVKDALGALVRMHRKRQQLVERIRQENVTEMILEPIYGLRTEDWLVDLAGPGWQKAAELERRIHGFYAAAMAKVSIPEVARRFGKLAEEGLSLEEQAVKLA